MSARFTHFLDPSGLHVVWDEHRQEPAMANGRMLVFTTLTGAITFTAVLNAGDSEQRSRQSRTVPEESSRKARREAGTA